MSDGNAIDDAASVPFESVASLLMHDVDGARDSLTRIWKSLVRKQAQCDRPILIIGPRGTGKRTLSRP
jgi:DNA-binding NtrC family response regulator